MNRQSITKNYIRIPREEYAKLKQLQKHFETFWKYFNHIEEIKEAREDLNFGKTISQEELFGDLKL